MQRFSSILFYENVFSIAHWSIFLWCMEYVLLALAVLSVIVECLVDTYLKWAQGKRKQIFSRAIIISNQNIVAGFWTLFHIRELPTTFGISFSELCFLMYGIWLGPNRDRTQNRPETAHFGKIQIFVAFCMTTTLKSLVGPKITFFV